MQWLQEVTVIRSRPAGPTHSESQGGEAWAAWARYGFSGSGSELPRERLPKGSLVSTFNNEDVLLWLREFAEVFWGDSEEGGEDVVGIGADAA